MAEGRSNLLTMSGDFILELANVTKRYEHGDANDGAVLAGVDLRVGAAEQLAVIGPSGSGKSTLLNIMGTLDRPSSGVVTLDGEDVASLSEARLAEVRNRKIGFVFQLHHLLPQCTLLENVLVPAIVNASSEDAEARARRLLDRVGLSHRINRRPGRVSGGERQRTAVVRALINCPSLLLADEPTGSLDQKGSDDLCSLLAELNSEENVAIVMVTHSLRQARKMARVLELEEGRLVESGNA